MSNDLDIAYAAMRRRPDSVEVSGEEKRFRNEAANAMAKYFAAVLFEQARQDGNGEGGYETLYDQRAPKGMILITTSIGVIRDLANGNTNASLDAFLDGVMRGQN